MTEKIWNPHPFKSPEWYKVTFELVRCCHQWFVDWMIKNWIHQIDTVLEVGCGKYDYYPNIFHNRHYTGIDIDLDVIEWCWTQIDNRERRHNWKCKSLWEMPPKSSDLVFSHAVIDHAESPANFITNSIAVAKKFVYIMSYRGFFTEIAEHEQEKGADGFFYNNISVQAAKEQLASHGSVERFDVVPVATKLPAGEIQHETHIKIWKKQ
jgi:SAM-dependent methyltransferase